MKFRAEVPGKFDLFDLHRLAPERYPFVLQSLSGANASGRYDLLLAEPGSLLRGHPGKDFFAELSTLLANEKAQITTDMPFCGGWFLLLGYEAARWVEPSLKLPASPYGLPDAVAVRCTAGFIYDHQRQVCTIVAEQSEAQLKSLKSDLEASLKYGPQAIDIELVSTVSEEAPEKYLAGVERILDYLKAGDVFQVNLSRHWKAALRSGVSYQQVYGALRRANPAPFAGLAKLGESVVLSSSPERLLRIEQGRAETRPIAGTGRRGADAAEDRQILERLLANVKERAEHVMLIDLERNDLGRVCEPGSVEVDELMRTETYAHVHHIVSNVCGRLRAGVGAGEAIRAVFPGGTITGCPKVRAMQIIAELEGVGRGPYTGAMGYLSRCGRLDLNILIRTLVVENGEVHLRAGAGIVADSRPEAELAETRAKARGLLLALGLPA